MTHPRRDLLSKLVMAIDRWQRRRLGIWAFTDDPECIVRVGRGTTHRRVDLADGTVVRPGETVGIIHLWNERMPQIPPTGSALRWALEFRRLLVHSLHLLAQYVAESPKLEGIEAFGGDLPFVFTPATTRFLRRLGFEVFDPVPARGPVEWAIDLGARTWTLLLRRTFNPSSADRLRLSSLRRRPVWFSRRKLLSLYAPEHTDVHKRTTSPPGPSGSPKE
jgi:hypothetical protein